MKTAKVAISAISLALLASCGGSKPDGKDTKASAPCAADQALYDAELASYVDGKCTQCHTAGGAAAGTGLVFEKGEGAKNLGALFEEAKKSSAADGDKPLLLVKPTGTSAKGHSGGAVIAEGSSAYLALSTIVERARGDIPCSAVTVTTCEPGVAPPSHRMIRRLSALEYQNTIADLLGMAPSVAAGLPTDTVVHHFDNNASVLLVSEAFANKVRIITENVIAAIDFTKLATCDGGPKDEACAKAFAETFGARAFRRPLSDAEVTDLMALYKAIAKGEGFQEGIRWMVGAMLQSPSFLYRTELGAKPKDGVYALTPYEIAAELSYTLWQTLPDEELTAAAADGSLSEPAVILAQARRMLADPRATATMSHFVDQWLSAKELPSSVKDPMIYPAWSPEVGDLMRRETFAFFSYVAQNGSFADLFTADYSFVNADLASYYGMSAPPGDPATFQKVTLPPGRRGVLTQGAFLASQSRPTHTSPTSRGKLVREMILGEPVDPPPPNVNTNLTDVSNLPTMREKLSVHAKDGVCKGCHERLDPIGFGFEGFDSDGRALMSMIDTTGEIVGSGDVDGAFDGPIELQNKLAQSKEAQRAFALHWFRFVFGVTEDGPSKCAAIYVGEEFAKGDLEISGLLESLVRLPPFTQRTAPGAIGPETPIPDPGPFDPGPAPPPPAGGPDPNGITTTLAYQQGSPWGTGYCKDGTTTNNGSMPAAWKATVAMGGYMLTSNWNSTVAVSGTDWVFSGDMNNATLAPGQTITWGFCASK